MKVRIKNNYLRVVQLLLCLFVFGFVGCSSLKDIEGAKVQSGESILQFSVSENDFVAFNQRTQELGLVAVDFRTAITNVSDSDNNEFWVTFRFVNEAVMIRSYVSLISSGHLKRISYSYR